LFEKLRLSEKFVKESKKVGRPRKEKIDPGKPKRPRGSPGKKSRTPREDRLAIVRFIGNLLKMRNFTGLWKKLG
jgi:hypothetical protein